MLRLKPFRASSGTLLPISLPKKQTFPTVLVTPGTKGRLNNTAAFWTFSVTTTFSLLFTGNSDHEGWISVNDRN